MRSLAKLQDILRWGRALLCIPAGGIEDSCTAGEEFDCMRAWL